MTEARFELDTSGHRFKLSSNSLQQGGTLKQSLEFEFFKGGGVKLVWVGVVSLSGSYICTYEAWYK